MKGRVFWLLSLPLLQSLLPQHTSSGNGFCPPRLSRSSRQERLNGGAPRSWRKETAPEVAARSIPPFTIRRSYRRSSAAVQSLASAPPESVSDSTDSGSLDHNTLVTRTLGLSQEQFDKLDQLCHLLLEWNGKMNLVSRQHDSPAVIWERHILPSLAALRGLPEAPPPGREAAADAPAPRLSPSGVSVVDVGTGGGFPGLPLAIARPDAAFCLLDSVGKKLAAVQDMADQLGLANVRTHHGRAEDLAGRRFDAATSRSVSALPNVCAWTHHLLRPGTGRLLYWIGSGERDPPADGAGSGGTNRHLIEPDANAATLRVDAILPGLESDKLIWILPQSQVSAIARDSGPRVQRSVAKPGAARRPARKGGIKGSDRSRGAWSRWEPSAPKDRGYQNFQRYNSLDDSRRRESS